MSGGTREHGYLIERLRAALRAAWMWRLGTEPILGLKEEGGGLRVDPCFPCTRHDRAARASLPRGVRY